MRKIRFLVIGIIAGLAGLIINSCIDPYNPPTSTANPAYLVIDGFLNTGDSSCTITLTHTVPLNKDSAFVPPPETSAIVQILDQDGIIFPLAETSKGVYSATKMNLDISKTYQLKITTKAKKQYLSDLVPAVKTPPIDSITYDEEPQGLQINVNSHDKTNSTRYYQWTFTETWKYQAEFDSEFVFVGDSAVAPRPINFFTCYQSDNSTSLLLGSSVQLSNDVISQFPLTTIPWPSSKITIKYSILVKQQGLTKSAYEYWQQIKKNTENLGTLFGPLPSTTIGNIQCTTDTEEPVIGYFSAGAVTEQRIFIPAQSIIRPSGSSFSTYYAGCLPLDSVLYHTPVVGEPVYPIYQEISIIGWLTAPLSCVDCRYQGGSLNKPDFWE